MRKSLLKSAPRYDDLREKLVELLALRAKVAKFEKTLKSRSPRQALTSTHAKVRVLPRHIGKGRPGRTGVVSRNQI
jgi:hypothetical protein